MDQFAAKHPSKAAALSMQSSKPELRTFKLKNLPQRPRQKIYRELLLVPKHNDDESADWWLNDHGELGELTEGLMIEIFEVRPYGIYPEIMRTNKKIHKGAAAILYGENRFTWSIFQ